MKNILYIQLIIFLITLTYGCKKRIPGIEHSISGVLYLDHTLQPAANYEVRLQYNSQAYSLRDTKILDECITDENGNFYLKYVKIAGAGELEIENSGGTALLTEIPVNEDINFSFPVKAFMQANINLTYTKNLNEKDTVFIDAQYIIDKNAQPGIVYVDSLKAHFFMLTKNYQPNQISAFRINGISYTDLIGYENDVVKCNAQIGLPIGYGLQNLYRNFYIKRAITQNPDLIDSTYFYYCYGPRTSAFSIEADVNINIE